MILKNLLNIEPTHKNWERWIYKSVGYQDSFERAGDTSQTFYSLKSSVTTVWNNQLSTSSPAVHETPKNTIHNSNESCSSSCLDAEICQICKLRYESPEDIPTDSHWVNYGNQGSCNWWFRIVCTSIYYPNNDHGEKKLDPWAAKYFSCKKHMLKPEKIGWYPTNNCELDFGQSKK